MILYHITSSENAAAIKRDGFRDTGGSYMTEGEHRGVEHRGVWLFDRPPDANEGAWGDTAIAVDLPLYREWLIPAAIINKYWWPITAPVPFRSFQLLRHSLSMYLC
jgi:hypothetical protein